MFPMIVSVGMCDLLRSGNLRVMEVHDQTLALSSIVVDLFFKISVDGHALQKFGGWKRKGCSLSAFTQFPIQKEKILPSTLAKNVDELWASAVPKNHPATVNKGCCTNGDVRLERLLHQYLRAIGSVLRPPKKKEHVCGLICSKYSPTPTGTTGTTTTTYYKCLVTVSGVPIPCRDGPAQITQDFFIGP